MRPSFVRRSGLVTGMLIVGLLTGLFGNQGTARAVGSVVYVVPGGAGAQDGQSWATARDLHAALMAAGSGDQLWVQAGTYTPGADRAATFALKTGVAVYGGFAGMETALGERDIASNVTTLSGELGAAGAGDNSYHVVTGSGTDATALLDGVTISGGNADDEANANGNGGGIYNFNGHPTLTNLIIAGNRAVHFGGGLYNYGSSPALTNVTISGNTVSLGNGGGLTSYANSNPVLRNVTIAGNAARWYGGGMYNKESSPVLRNVIISGNVASDKGGGMWNLEGSPVLTNVIISGNTAVAGGGLYNYYSYPTLRNSIVWNNSGGAITNLMSWPDVEYSLVNVDPLFVAAVPTAPSTGGDLHLQAGSPAINAGDNAALPADITTDRDSLPRIVALTVDMGAFERQTAQAITFAPVGTKAYGDPPFDVTATATSGLPVTLTAAGVCTVAGSTVTLTGLGTCTLTAIQAGDTTHDSAQATLAIPVTRVATSTTLRSSRNPTVSGQNVTFTARVTSSSDSGTPSGTVTFRDGTTVLGRRPLSAGKATLTLNTLSVGRHSITARYNGNASYTPAVSTVLLQRVTRP